MLYNLRIGKTRYTGKTLEECRAIIAARLADINRVCMTRADVIRLDLATGADLIRLAYYGRDGKMYVSVNRMGG